MSEAPPLRFELSPDRQVLIVVPASPEPFGMNALVTEELIHVLIACRAAMEPRRMPIDPFGGEQMLSHPDMRWYAAPSPDGSGQVQICMAHPGLGWMGMVLDREGAEKLIGLLQQFLSATD